jgi:hypothetical protein
MPKGGTSAPPADSQQRYKRQDAGQADKRQKGRGVQKVYCQCGYAGDIRAK